MALAIVADMDERKMEDNVRKLAGKYFLEAGTSGNERVIQPVKSQTPFNRSVEKRNHEVNAVIGNFAPSLYGSDERFAAILLGNIIGGPASNSLLNSLLRERNGWVYGVETSYSQYSEAGIMTISLGCERGNLEKCLDAVWKVIRKMQEEEYSSVKLKAAKKQLLGQLAISSDNGETQCLSMGKSLVSYGTIFTDRQNREAIEAVTAEALRDAAVKIFNPGRTSSLIFL